MKKDKGKENEANCKPEKKKTGANPPEAWAEANNYDEDTKVHNPSEDSVEEAKEWVDDESQL